MSNPLNIVVPVSIISTSSFAVGIYDFVLDFIISK